MGRDAGVDEAIGPRRTTSRRRLVVAAAALPLVGMGALSRGQVATTSPATPASGAASPVPSPERAGLHGVLEVVGEQRPTYVGPPARGGALRIIRPRPATLAVNPLAMLPDPQVVYSLYEPLLRPDPVTMEPTAWLATAWSTSSDGLAIDIAVRRDVRWHDGSPFTAADAATTLLAYRDDPASGVRNIFTALVDAKALDDWRLQLRLSEPDVNLPLNGLSQPIVQRAQYD